MGVSCETKLERCQKHVPHTLDYLRLRYTCHDAHKLAATCRSLRTQHLCVEKMAREVSSNQAWESKRSFECVYSNIRDGTVSAAGSVVTPPPISSAIKMHSGPSLHDSLLQRQKSFESGKFKTPTITIPPKYFKARPAIQQTLERSDTTFLVQRRPNTYSTDSVMSTQNVRSQGYAGFILVPISSQQAFNLNLPERCTSRESTEGKMVESVKVLPRYMRKTIGNRGLSVCTEPSTLRLKHEMEDSAVNDKDEITVEDIDGKIDANYRKNSLVIQTGETPENTDKQKEESEEIVKFDNINEFPAVQEDNQEQPKQVENKRLSLYAEKRQSVVSENKRQSVLSENKRLSVLSETKIPSAQGEPKKQSLEGENKRRSIKKRTSTMGEKKTSSIKGEIKKLSAQSNNKEQEEIGSPLTQVQKDQPSTQQEDQTKMDGNSEKVKRNSNRSVRLIRKKTTKSGKALQKEATISKISCNETDLLPQQPLLPNYICPSSEEKSKEARLRHWLRDTTFTQASRHVPLV